MADDLIEWDDFLDELERDDDEAEPSLPPEWKPYTHVLDEIIEKHASAEAKKNRWKSGERLRVHAAHVARHFIVDLFTSVYRENIPADERSSHYQDDTSNKRYYSRWRHRSVHDLNKDIAELQIDGPLLRQAVTHYLKDPRWRSEYLDWYIANTLTYAELYQFVQQAQAMMRGVITTVLVRGTATQKFLGYLLRLVLFVVKWAIWFVGAFFANETWGGGGVVVLVIATVAWQIHKWRGRKKVHDLIIAMRSAYDVFASKTFSWEVAWAELNSSREKGAVWPGELYRLVELRKAGQ